MPLFLHQKEQEPLEPRARATICSCRRGGHRVWQITGAHLLPVNTITPLPPPGPSLKPSRRDLTRAHSCSGAPLPQPPLWLHAQPASEDLEGSGASWVGTQLGKYLQKERMTGSPIRQPHQRRGSRRRLGPGGSGLSSTLFSAPAAAGRTPAGLCPLRDGISNPQTVSPTQGHPPPPHTGSSVTPEPSDAEAPNG